jgi:hypothetical protein
MVALNKNSIMQISRAGGGLRTGVERKTNGGTYPRCRRDGKELYYLSLDRKLAAVEVKATATTFETGRPRELFQTRAATASPYESPPTANVS